jgi:hypothetical protein
MCDNCNEGEMEKPYPPASGDFNEDGILEHFCNECGYGFPREVNNIEIEVRYVFSQRKLKRIIHKLFTKNGFPYWRKEPMRKEINQKCKDVDEVVSFFDQLFDENVDFLEKLCDMLYR